MRLHGRNYSREDLERLAGDLAAVGGVRAVVLDDGLERGIRALEFRTGAGLRFEVLVDRAMDIGVAELSDCSVGWRSATGFRHPGLHEVNDEGGLSWLRSMSGLLVTCGLDHAFQGREVDASHYRYPPKPSVRHGLHGRVANIPARLFGYGERWEDGRVLLWAEGEVRQAAIFGEHLRLQRRIEADLGGTEIRLIDTVTNTGFDPTPHMYLYHLNIGWPMLDEGTTLEAKITSTPWTSDSVTEGASHLVFGGPVLSFVEQLYEHKLAPDADGRTRVRLRNTRLRHTFELEYDQREFPVFYEWLNLRAGDYAVAFEPSTHRPSEKAGEADGSTIWLEHGEQRSYHSVLRFALKPTAAPHI